jgi:hypothetical protein
MLRVTRIETATEQKLILEGRLTEPWITGIVSLGRNLVTSSGAEVCG